MEDEEANAAASEEKAATADGGAEGGEGAAAADGPSEEGKGGDEEGKTADAAAPAEPTADAGAEEGKGEKATAEGEAVEGAEGDATAVPAPAPAPAVKKTKIVKVKKIIKVYECKLLMDVNNVGTEMNDLPLASFMRSKDGNVPVPADIANAPVLQESLEFNYMTGTTCSTWPTDEARVYPCLALLRWLPSRHENGRERSDSDMV